MKQDKKKIYIISVAILVALIITLFLPVLTGRILGAIILFPCAIVCLLLIKKRNVLSINTNQIIMIMSVMGVVYLVLYYLSIFRFGYVKTGYGLKWDNLLKLIIPILTIIVSSEIIRFVLQSQKNKIVTVLAYLVCLIADVLICANISGINTFSTFMDVVGLTLFPGIIYNLLYNYLSTRYGILPNLIYRILTVLVFYFIPYGSGISDSLIAFINILIPLGIYFFIDSLYERKRRYALGETSVFVKRLSKVFTAICLVLMLAAIMLISNQFRYGAFVIATESMTGEINKGDIIIYEEYGDQVIFEGLVIVFEKDNSVIIHRVEKIEIINGIKRYYTKGDANEDRDAGFITEGNIIGVVNYKLPFLGYPSLWIRNLFKR